MEISYEHFSLVTIELDIFFVHTNYEKIKVACLCVDFDCHMAKESCVSTTDCMAGLLARKRVSPREPYFIKLTKRAFSVVIHPGGLSLTIEKNTLCSCIAHEEIVHTEQ